MCLQKFKLNIRALCSSPESLLVLDQYLLQARISLNEERKSGVLPFKLHHLSSAPQGNTSLLSQPLPNSLLHTLPYTLVHSSRPFCTGTFAVRVI